MVMMMVLGGAKVQVGVVTLVSKKSRRVRVVTLSLLPSSSFPPLFFSS